MEISLDVLNYLLPKTSIHSCNGSNLSIKYIFIYHREENPEENELYIARYEDILASEPEAINGMVFALVGADEEQCKDLLKKYNCSFLLFPKHVSVAQAHRDIQTAMSRFYDWLNQLDNAVFRSNNVKEILSYASEMFSDPVLAWNPAFELTATANTENLDLDRVPEMMRNFLVNKCWSGEDVDSMLKNHDYLTMPTRYLDIRLITPPNMLNCYSCARIFSLSGKIVMTSGVYFVDGNLPHAGKIEIIRQLFYRVMSFFKLHSDAYTGSKKIYELFILELIEGKLNNDADIRDRLSYINFPYTGEFEVLIVGSDNSEQTLALQIIRNHCKTFFRHAKFIEYQNHLIGLNNRARDTSGAIKNRSEMFSGVNGMSEVHLGISSVFSCLKDTEKAFNQAKIALKFGKNLKSKTQYYRYEDFFVYHMLNQASSSSNDIMGCPDASYIYKLREMDALKKGVNNEKLFVTYILSGCNTSKTAEIMNLHRNSILYRVNQIVSQLNVDLTNPETIFHMILGIKAVELQDALNEKRGTRP